MHDLEGDTPCSVAAGVNHKEVPLLAERCGGKGRCGRIDMAGGRWPSQLFLGVSHVTRGGGGDRLTFEFAGEKQNRNPFFFIRYGAHSSQDRGRERLQQPCPASSFLHLGWALLADQHHVAAVRRKLGGGCIRAFGDEFFESD